MFKAVDTDRQDGNVKVYSQAPSRGTFDSKEALVHSFMVMVIRAGRTNNDPSLFKELDSTQKIKKFIETHGPRVTEKDTVMHTLLN